MFSLCGVDYQKTYTQDGVCLTESGLNQLQALSAPAPRRRRPKPKLKLKIINQNSVAVLQTPPDPLSELSRDGYLDDGRGEPHTHTKKTHTHHPPLLSVYPICLFAWLFVIELCTVRECGILKTKLCYFVHLFGCCHAASYGSRNLQCADFSEL